MLTCLRISNNNVVVCEQDTTNSTFLHSCRRGFSYVGDLRSDLSRNRTEASKGLLVGKPCWFVTQRVNTLVKCVSVTNSHLTFVSGCLWREYGHTPFSHVVQEHTHRWTQFARLRQGSGTGKLVSICTATVCSRFCNELVAHIRKALEKDQSCRLKLTS